MVINNLLSRGVRTSQMVLLILACALSGLTLNTARGQSILQAERGITSSFRFQYEGPALRARAQRETEPPLVVRLQRTSKENSADYEARFIGNITGQYDLRDWIEHIDGSPINTSQPMLVDVVSTLPKDPRSDLFDVDGFQPSLVGGYRFALGLMALAWLAVPVVILLRKLLAKPPEVATEHTAPPMTLADQLRPLVDLAARGEMSTTDKARFELLLVHYYREQANLPDLDMARSIQQLRSHAQAGPIIAAVEQWLHAADSNTDDHSDSHSAQRVLGLLEPLQSSNLLRKPTSIGVAGSAGSSTT